MRVGRRADQLAGLPTVGSVMCPLGMASTAFSGVSHARRRRPVRPLNSSQTTDVTCSLSLVFQWTSRNRPEDSPQAVISGCVRNSAAVGDTYALLCIKSAKLYRTR